MKKKLLLFIPVLLFILIMILVFVFTRFLRDKLVYENAKIKVTFNVIDDYKLKEDSKYFRTAREKAILVGNTFKIGLELNDDLITENISFDEYKKKYEKEEDFKEVKYSGKKGFQFYTPAYLRYEIYLPVEDNIIIRFNIYSANDNKNATTKELESDAVQDILNHIDIEVK